MASPAKLAHIVIKTGALQEMLDWYVSVLDGRVVFATDAFAFMTYDAEHHRVGFLNIPGAEKPGDLHTGLAHVAFTYDTLEELLDNYTRLKDTGTLPYWNVNHGPTTSMYYADPDGNNVELQYDNFKTDDELQQFVDSGKFNDNPIGIEYSPEDLIRGLAEGVPVKTLVQLP